MPAAKRTRKANGSTMSKQEVLFDYDQATKGTHRFREADAGDGKRPIMGTVWLRKDVAEKLGVDHEGTGIQVTIEADTE